MGSISTSDLKEEEETTTTFPQPSHSIIGLTMDEAKKVFVERGIFHGEIVVKAIRVYMSDDGNEDRTKDLRDYRLNVETREGKIVNILGCY